MTIELIGIVKMDGVDVFVVIDVEVIVVSIEVAPFLGSFFVSSSPIPSIYPFVSLYGHS